MNRYYSFLMGLLLCAPFAATCNDERFMQEQADAQKMAQQELYMLQSMYDTLKENFDSRRLITIEDTLQLLMQDYFLTAFETNNASQQNTLRSISIVIHSLTSYFDSVDSEKMNALNIDSNKASGFVVVLHSIAALDTIAQELGQKIQDPTSLIEAHAQLNETIAKCYIV